MNIHRAFQYYLITDHNQYRQPIHEAAHQAELNDVTYFQLREKKMQKGNCWQLRIISGLSWIRQNSLSMAIWM